MPVIPTEIDTSGTITTLHEEADHTGTVRLTTLQFARAVDGTVDRRYIGLPCSVCGVVSWHPISGGCDAKRVQALFARALVTAAGNNPNWSQLKQQLQDAIAALDGPGRFRLTQVNSLQDLQAALG